MRVGEVDITWFGHASFMIEHNGFTIYIDPYILPDDPKPADLILVTHDHFDHCAPDNIRGLLKDETVVITTKKAEDKCPGEVRVLEADESLDIRGVRIHAVWAYNINKQFHPKGLGVGFVIEIAGKKIYHAGDTDVIPEMADLEHFHIDVALLPVGGTYTMDINEALEAVKLIKPKIVVPMHYNSLDGLEISDSELSRFKDRVESLGAKCVILTPVK